MKIAVAVENNQVCGHFGHSPSFSFYEIEDGKVVSVTNIQSPGKGHGILPEFIAENGATAVLVGGMGAGAVSGCQSKGIEVVMGVTGNPDDAASLYAKGELKSTGSICSHHHDDHSHGEGGSCSHSHSEHEHSHGENGSCSHHGNGKCGH